MKTRNTQRAICRVLVLVGAVLFAYGVIFHSASVMPQKDKDAQLLELSEPALIRDVAVGGVKLDESGRIARTYTGQAPEACPT